MLGDRIDVVEDFDFKFERIPAVSARQKTTTAVVKRNKMSGLDRKHRQT